MFIYTLAVHGASLKHCHRNAHMCDVHVAGLQCFLSLFFENMSTLFCFIKLSEAVNAQSRALPEQSAHSQALLLSTDFSDFKKMMAALACCCCHNTMSRMNLITWVTITEVWWVQNKNSNVIAQIIQDVFASVTPCDKKSKGHSNLNISISQYKLQK